MMNSKANLFTIWWKGMVWFLAIVSPLTFIIVPALMIYDSISPVPQIESALEASYPEQTHLCISLASESIGGKVTWYQRTYLVFPQFVRESKTISVTMADGKDLEITESSSSLFFILLYYAVMVVITIKLSIPRYSFLLSKLFFHSSHTDS